MFINKQADLGDKGISEKWADFRDIRYYSFT